MIKEAGAEYMDNMKQRLDERLEYLKRDVNLLVRNLTNIKDSVLHLSGEVEKITRVKED